MKNLKPLRYLALIAFAAVVAGCSTDRVSGPTGPDVSAPLTYDYDSMVIGPSGGALSVSGISLEVPAGALSQTVLMTMTRLSDGSVELGPHGLQFMTPVSLSFDIPAGVDTARTSVSWFNPAAQKWTTIPSLAADRARSASLAHFSKYTLVTIAEEM